MGKKNRQQSGSSPKVPLLDSEEWLSAQLLRALQTVFQRFDADGDGALNEAELQAFARACNGGTELDADELDQIQDYFDTDDSGALTLRGFHEMYHMQTRSRSAASGSQASSRRCGRGPRRTAGVRGGVGEGINKGEERNIRLQHHQEQPAAAIHPSS